MHFMTDGCKLLTPAENFGGHLVGMYKLHFFLPLPSLRLLLKILAQTADRSILVLHTALRSECAKNRPASRSSRRLTGRI